FNFKRMYLIFVKVFVKFIKHKMYLNITTDKKNTKDKRKNRQLLLIITSSIFVWYFARILQIQHYSKKKDLENIDELYLQRFLSCDFMGKKSNFFLKIPLRTT
ncbi:hypothetical protein H311_05195, partial [Anncaliia algerae PRA109]